MTDNNFHETNSEFLRKGAKHSSGSLKEGIWGAVPSEAIGSFVGMSYNLESSTRGCGGCNPLEGIGCYVQNTIQKN